jgi:prevent-host-death family protein
MYTLDMSTYSITDARQELPAVIDEAQKKPVFIQRHGQSVAVVISHSYYEKLLTALEDIEDLTAIRESLANPKPSIPWEQVKRELGF